MKTLNKGETMETKDEHLFGVDLFGEPIKQVVGGELLKRFTISTLFCV